MTSPLRALSHEAFETATGQSAVLAPDGTVLMVNRAWRHFGERTGADAGCGPGANYLDVAERSAQSGDDVAAAVGAALAAVLTGNAPVAQLDYPCDSPDKLRWFRLHAELLPGRGELLVVHDDITDQVRLPGPVPGSAVPAPRAHTRSVPSR